MIRWTEQSQHIFIAVMLSLITGANLYMVRDKTTGAVLGFGLIGHIEGGPDV